MKKVSSRVINVATPNSNETGQQGGPLAALSFNGYRPTSTQYVPRRFGVRTGKVYDIVERESDGLLFVVRGSNQDSTISLSRYTGGSEYME